MISLRSKPFCNINFFFFLDLYRFSTVYISEGIKYLGFTQPPQGLISVETEHASKSLGLLRNGVLIEQEHYFIQSRSKLPVQKYSLHMINVVKTR